MKLRKADEMEQSHNSKAAKNAFLFYSVALLVWCIYHFIDSGELGWPFIILLGGNLVFWSSRVVLHRQTDL